MATESDASAAPTVAQRLAGVLAVGSAVVQIVSWIWPTSRNWVESHGLSVSGGWLVLLLLLWRSTELRMASKDEQNARLRGTIDALRPFNYLKQDRDGIESAARPSQSQEERYLVPIEAMPWILDGQHRVAVIVVGAPIDKVRAAALVSSENTYFQMSQTFKTTISGTVRSAAAKKTGGNRIVDDVAQDQLNSWMRQTDGSVAEVEAGTVAPTNPHPDSALAQNGVKRIYHAAVVRPATVGRSDYSTSREVVVSAIENVLRAIGTDNAGRNDESKIDSVAIPLLGAGRGDFGVLESLDAIISTVEAAVKARSSTIELLSTVYLVSWNKGEVATMCHHLGVVMPIRDLPRGVAGLAE